MAENVIKDLNGLLVGATVSDYNGRVIRLTDWDRRYFVYIGLHDGESVMLDSDQVAEIISAPRKEIENV